MVASPSMLARFRKLFGRKSPPRTPMEALDAGLGVPPADRDLTRLMPIILPLEVSEMDWPGPIVRLEHLPFCYTWTTCGEMNTFFHVTHKEVEFWESKGVDWRAIAMRNLKAVTETRPNFGYKLDDNGQPFVQVMLQEDALGPSRLLIPHLFDDILGPDYLVAIPEQTCAIAFRRELSESQAADIDSMIDGCFANGTEPMSVDRFNPRYFWQFVD